MNFEINLWAVIVATVSSFTLGGIWYSPALFGNAWLKAAKLSETDMTKSHPMKIYLGVLLFSAVSATVFAIYLGTQTELSEAVLKGFAVGSAFVACSFGLNYLFEQRSMLLLLINAGYHIVQFTLYGLILGLWA